MASLMGVLKKIFGSSSSAVKDAAHTASDKMTEVKASAEETYAKTAETVSHTAHDISEKVSHVAETVTEKVTEAAPHVIEETVEAAQHYSEAAGSMAEAAAHKMQEVAEAAVSVGAGVSAETVTAAEDAVKHVVETVSETVSEAVHQVVGDEAGVPHLPPLALTSPVEYLDRDAFVLPRSNVSEQAMDSIAAEAGDVVLARGIRVFEYGVAASAAYGLRVDRELLLLGALFGETGDDASAKARSFCVEKGMWEALADKVAFAITHRLDGATTDDIEARALALGVQAEAAGGQVDYINGATAAETISRNS